MIKVDKYIITCECCDLQIVVEYNPQEFSSPSGYHLHRIKAYLENAGWCFNCIRKCWTCPICRGE